MDSAWLLGIMLGDNDLMQTTEELTSIEDLDRALDESRNRPVLIFKHSLSCPISARAFRQFESYLENGNPQVSHKLIIVQRARDTSDKAAERLGLRHETPQAILVRDGREVWNASHHDITASSLAAAVDPGPK
jgi:bacillithiol system protein YtxJ